METEQKIWRQAPDQITAWGIGNEGGPVDPAQVKVCERWLREFATPQNEFNYRRTSYGLKHTVEGWARQYVTNGAFMQAAVNLGYRYRQVTKYNASFNMRVRKTPRGEGR